MTSSVQKKQTAIQVKNLYKVFGAHTKQALSLVTNGESRFDIQQATDALVALRDITFNVSKGEIFVLMGLSGSGKSTLLRCINRLQEPTSGSVYVEGADITALSSKELRIFRRSMFGMVFQHFALFPHRTVAENVAFGLEIQNTHTEERMNKAYETLRVVGLDGWEHKRTRELSGGMQQRVGLARALATDPHILLMDEPFSALDPLIRTQLQDELLRLHAELERTVLFVTHDLNEAIRLGHRIAILNSEGRIVQIDTPENILLHPADNYVERFLSEVNRPAVIRMESIMHKPRQGGIPTGSEHIHRHSVIKEALPALITSNRPIAVVDDNRVCIGEVDRNDIARVLKKDVTT